MAILWKHTQFLYAWQVFFFERICSLTKAGSFMDRGAQIGIFLKYWTRALLCKGRGHHRSTLFVSYVHFWVDCWFIFFNIIHSLKEGQYYLPSRPDALKPFQYGRHTSSLRGTFTFLRLRCLLVRHMCLLVRHMCLLARYMYLLVWQISHFVTAYVPPCESLHLSAQ